jgi:hypothetical protein
MVIVAEGQHRHDRGMYDTGQPRAACGAGFQLQSRDAARKRISALAPALDFDVLRAQPE